MMTAMMSEALVYALQRGLVTKDMVAECDPALMFIIPRVAIVRWVFVCVWCI